MPLFERQYTLGSDGNQSSEMQSIPLSREIVYMIGQDAQPSETQASALQHMANVAEQQRLAKAQRAAAVQAYIDAADNRSRLVRPEQGVAVNGFRSLSPRKGPPASTTDSHYKTSSGNPFTIIKGTVNDPYKGISSNGGKKKRKYTSVLRKKYQQRRRRRNSTKKYKNK
jgi:hypothetical protein